MEPKISTPTRVYLSLLKINSACRELRKHGAIKPVIEYEKSYSEKNLKKILNKLIEHKVSSMVINGTYAPQAIVRLDNCTVNIHQKQK